MALKRLTGPRGASLSLPSSFCIRGQLIEKLVAGVLAGICSAASYSADTKEEGKGETSLPDRVSLILQAST